MTQRHHDIGGGDAAASPGRTAAAAASGPESEGAATSGPAAGLTSSAGARRKVALLANCLLNQNAKVCEGARYAGLVSPVVEALRERGYELLQLPCPELAFAGARRWWAVYEQYDTPAYRTHCRRLAQAIAPLIERHLRQGDELVLIGLDGSPSTGVRFTSTQPDWGGRPNRPQDDWRIEPRRGIWIEELEAELERRGLPPIPATGWALDMGRFDEAGSRRDLEAFLDARASQGNEARGAGQAPCSGPSGAPTAGADGARERGPS